LILLDLNLPRLTGYEVLAAAKENAEISSIPVIVMSGSEAPRDVNYSYAAGASAYVVKPESPSTAVRLVEAIESIWFTLGRTPTAE
jgi:CheY-like chemotaxis protein